MSQATARAPAPAWTFGLASLIPFYIASGFYCYGPESVHRAALLALLGWSGAMLSYLGGVRAGLEIESHDRPRWLPVALSMLAPAVAVLLLVGAATGRLSPVAEVSGFLTAFLLVWLWDQRAVDGPAWRRRFRTIITAGAAIALAFALEQALSM